MALFELIAKHVVEKIVEGAIMHHGEICMSTDSIVVVQDATDELIQELRMGLETRHSGSAGHAVSNKQSKRAHNLLHKAHAAGARFLVGDGSLNAAGTSLTPTIITDVSPQTKSPMRRFSPLSPFSPSLRMQQKPSKLQMTKRMASTARSTAEISSLRYGLPGRSNQDKSTLATLRSMMSGIYRVEE